MGVRLRTGAICAGLQGGDVLGPGDDGVGEFGQVAVVGAGMAAKRAERLVHGDAQPLSQDALGLLKQHALVSALCLLRLPLCRGLRSSRLPGLLLPDDQISEPRRGARDRAGSATWGRRRRAP